MIFFFFETLQIYFDLQFFVILNLLNKFLFGHNSFFFKRATMTETTKTLSQKNL